MANNYGRFGVGEIPARRRNPPRYCALRAALRIEQLTRRATHRYIFIIATIKPAPENPLRSFSIGQVAVGQSTAGRTGIGHHSEPNALIARAAPADRRAPEDDGQAEPEVTLPRHRASHPSSTLPSSTCLQTSKANPALSARCGHARARPKLSAISVGDDQCPITLWCRWTIGRISLTTRSFPLTMIRSLQMA